MSTTSLNKSCSRRQVTCVALTHSSFVDEGVSQTLFCDARMFGRTYQETGKTTAKSFLCTFCVACLTLKMKLSKLAHLHLWQMRFVQEIGEPLNFCSGRMVSLTQLFLYRRTSFLSIGREGKWLRMNSKELAYKYNIQEKVDKIENKESKYWYPFRNEVFKYQLITRFEHF